MGLNVEYDRKALCCIFLTGVCHVAYRKGGGSEEGKREGEREGKEGEGRLKKDSNGREVKRDEWKGKWREGRTRGWERRM